MPSTSKEIATTLTRSNLHSIFGEPDVPKRLKALSELWAADGEIAFVDPMGVFKTHAEISGMVDKILGMGAPGDSFREIGDVETLRDEAQDIWITRLKWCVAASTGETKIAGTDIITIKDGKITSCYTFFDSK